MLQSSRLQHLRPLARQQQRFPAAAACWRRGSSVAALSRRRPLRIACAASSSGGSSWQQHDGSTPSLEQQQQLTGGADAAVPAAPGAAAPRTRQLLLATASALALGLALCLPRAQAAPVSSPGSSATVSRSSSSSSSSPLASLTHAVAEASVPAGRPHHHHHHSHQQQPDLMETLQYKTMQLITAPALGKVVAVMAVALPIIALGGALYRRAAGPEETSWQEALGRTYAVLNNCPGSTVESERGLAADLVLHLVYIMGLFTFAIVVGIVTDDIGTQVEQVRRGNHPVIERQHVVVMNWNQQTLHVLKQMALARAESSGKLFAKPVVVLADREREEMDDAIEEELDELELTVITRTGNPAKPSDQKRVAAASADTVLLMWPSELPPANASAQQAAVLSVLKASGGIAHQKVVVQSAGKEVAEYDAAQLAVNLARSSTNNRQVTSLITSGSERINQIMAQVANQPGLEDVFADLLEYEAGGDESLQGAEFYLEPMPDNLAGQPYSVVRRCFPEATVVGWIGGGDEGLHLNAKDALPVPAGSQLVFVAGSAGQTVLDAPYQVSPPQVRGRRNTRMAPRNTTVLCFDSESAASAVASVAEFSSRGSAVTVVCEEPDLDALQAIKRRGVKIHIVAGSPSSKAVLTSAARLEEADAVMLCGLRKLEPSSGDMQVVASVLQLQALAAQHAGREKPLAVVATLNSPSIEDVLWHTTLSFHAELRAEAAAAAAREAAAWQGKHKGWLRRTQPPPEPAAAAAAVHAPVSLHLLRPDELMSGMLTQTTCSPQLASVFTELFTQQDGHEMYLREPSRAYGLPLNTPLLWKEVTEAVRRRGDTAVGYTAAGNADALAGQHSDVHLVMGAEQELVLRPGDQLVVVALE